MCLCSVVLNCGSKLESSLFPLQEKIVARAGMAIARSTLADWIGRCDVALPPLMDELRESLHQQTGSEK